MVLALDLTRAARDPQALKAFIQWAENVIASCPAAIQKSLPAVISLLKESITQITQVYTGALNPLIHRPGLILVGYLTSSLYLLEHAAWSWAQKTEIKDVDVEVLKRWALDNGFKGALEDVQKAMESGDAKIELDKQIAFGAGGSLTGKGKVAKL